MKEILKRFEEKFVGWKLHHKTSPCVNDNFALEEIKSFIRKTREEAYKDGKDFGMNYMQDYADMAYNQARQEMKEEIEKKIGMMRQWLNEDRITDNKKLVSDEELMYFFNLK